MPQENKVNTPGTMDAALDAIRRRYGINIKSMEGKPTESLVRSSLSVYHQITRDFQSPDAFKNECLAYLFRFIYLEGKSKGDPKNVPVPSVTYIPFRDGYKFWKPTILLPIDLEYKGVFYKLTIQYKRETVTLEYASPNGKVIGGLSVVCSQDKKYEGAIRLQNEINQLIK